MFVFTWLNDQLLKMVWLNELVGNILAWIGIDIETRFGSSVQFFAYDVIKIFILLSVLIYSISYIQSFFPPERTRSILGRFHGVSARIVAALLGTVTPFCSCSSIPLFIGFTNAGVPIGVTFSFLISSPLVDLASVFLLASIFNWNVALAYVFVGLVLAVVGGTLISWLKMEKYVEPFVYESPMVQLDMEDMTRKDRMNFAKEQVLFIIRKVWVFVIVGVGIGAAIHNYIPEAWITAVLGIDKWYSVPLATLVGVPMYADIFGTLPIASALVEKGVGLGTVLAFMMAVTTLSLPSIILLRNAVKPRLLTLFVAYCTVGIMLIGFVFNILMG
jgi:uncharacterized membrane protein YraQ (UPF0718 family)